MARESRPWWQRSSTALHPRQRARLGLPPVEESEEPTCRGCGTVMKFTVPGREPFCSRDCRLSTHGLVDATCAVCGNGCAVRPEHADHAYCATCRHRNNERKRA